MPEVDHVQCLFNARVETVKHRPHRVPPENRDRVVPRVPLMDYHALAHFSGQFELLFEGRRLCGLDRFVPNLGLDRADRR